jgi:putative sigma-54 modulation protein
MEVGMEITVSARHVAVSDELKSYAESKIGRLDRFDGAMERAEVRFKEERNPRISAKERCEVTIYGKGHVVRAHGAAFEQFAAVDLVVDKLELQLTKLKTRLKDRYRGKGHVPVDVVHTVGVSDAVPSEGAFDGTLESVEGAVAVEAPPKVVRVKTFEMPAMTVEDAITQLEMVSHEFYVFHNVETGEIEVLYRRDDGDVGLIRSDR